MSIPEDVRFVLAFAVIVLSGVALYLVAKNWGRPK